MPRRSETLAETIHVDLVRSVFRGFVPSLIMSIGFMGAGAIILARDWDPLLAMLSIVGGIASIARLFVAMRWRREAEDPALGVERARILEQRFAIGYLCFAVILGGFGARALMLPSAEIHMLVVCLLIGYGAGAGAGMALRPKVSIPAIIVAIVPAMIVCLFGKSPLYMATGAIGIAFVAAGVRSIAHRHRDATIEIGRRITFALLARSDPLTGLPNRLALHEWFDGRTWSGRGDRLALHCLDLDGFKPVNDSYGHPVGDVLLTAVAGRLAGAVRTKDIVARLGGDEFVVVQQLRGQGDEATRLARRLVDAIAEPFEIDGHVIRISTCVGYVLSAGRQIDLEQLIGLADQSLYDAKRRGAGFIGHRPSAIGSATSAAA